MESHRSRVLTRGNTHILQYLVFQDTLDVPRLSQVLISQGEHSHSSILSILGNLGWSWVVPVRYQEQYSCSDILWGHHQPPWSGRIRKRAIYYCSTWSQLRIGKRSLFKLRWSMNDLTRSLWQNPFVKCMAVYTAFSTQIPNKPWKSVTPMTLMSSKRYMYTCKLIHVTIQHVLFIHRLTPKSVSKHFPGCRCINEQLGTWIGVIFFCPIYFMFVTYTIRKEICFVNFLSCIIIFTCGLLSLFGRSNLAEEPASL